MTLKAGRRRVRISNPDKVLFPDDGITKEDLARYYAAVAPAMVPHVRDRPLNLWRWNRGIENELVIQQAIPKGAPDWVKRVTVSRRRGGEVTHAVGGEAATLVWLANQNCITPHVWTARCDKPDQPGPARVRLRPARRRRLASGGDPGGRAGGRRPAARARPDPVRDDLRARAGSTSSRRCAAGRTRTRCAPGPASSPRRSPGGCPTSSRRRGARRGAAVACWWTRRATPTRRRRWRRTRCAPSRARRWRRRCSGTRSRMPSRGAGRCATCRRGWRSGAIRGRGSPSAAALTHPALRAAPRAAAPRARPQRAGARAPARA